MSGLIVHEWIARHGGSENVAEAMAAAFPGTDVLSLWNDAPERFAGSTVTESWLGRTPLRRAKALALPFMPRVWKTTDVSDRDWVLVSSHLFAHHVGGAAAAPRKFVYVHTPARYIWNPELDARGNSLPARLISPSLRRLDRARAAEGARFAANSAYVRERIRQAWGQDAAVIHPPVSIARLQAVELWSETLDEHDADVLASLPRQFVLGASRFVPYKRLDLAISAGEATGMPVVIAGSGPGRADLARQSAGASVPVRIVDAPSDALLYAIFQRAAVFVFPPIEDFGIMPVEAIALGTPVLVNPLGGARESVELLGGGAVLDGMDAGGLRRGIHAALDSDVRSARAAVADAFGEQAFSRRLREWMAAHGAQLG